MPSVEMRRTTRVFGARVLRSGRRLITSEEKLKHMRRTHPAVEDADENWIEFIDHDGGDVDLKENGWHNSPEAHNDELMEIDREPQSEIKLGELGELREGDSVEHINTGCKRWGLVYSRKRKRTEPSTTDRDTSVCSDKKYGKKFVRKQPRKTIITQDPPTNIQTLPPKVTTTKQNQPPIKRHLPLRSKSKRKKKLQIGTSFSNLPPRSNITIHRAIQKRRSSFRSRKQKNPSIIQDGVPFFPIKSNPELTRSIHRPNFKELKSTLTELTQNIDSASCTANILVIESDRCYRETGAIITMENPAPKQWFLVVKINGSEKFRVETRTAMRSCFHNRVTHSIIWAGNDETWRLEFPNRQDWFVFKELYRKCSERSVKVKSTLTSIIPVPRVNEVKGYADVECLPFKMPDSYIESRGDEVSRVLERSEAVYDMDSEDDDWLKKFSVDLGVKVSEDDFERIVDGFERGIYGSPEDYADVAVVVERCRMLGSKEVLEGVYDYWMAKRKKKHSALVPVFQFYKPKRTEQLNTKGILRKKRSFRQRGSQTGRGKQLTFLKAALYEKKTEEADNAANKVEETEECAKKGEEMAIVKRERAQMLMEVADLLTYKATMALRIAEACGTCGGQVDEGFFGEWFGN